MNCFLVVFVIHFINAFYPLITHKINVFIEIQNNKLFSHTKWKNFCFNRFFVVIIFEKIYCIHKYRKKIDFNNNKSFYSSTHTVYIGYEKPCAIEYYFPIINFYINGVFIFRHFLPPILLFKTWAQKQCIFASILVMKNYNQFKR